MVQYDREDLATGRVRWTDLTPPEWRGHDEQAVADLKATGIFRPLEKEYFRKDGSRVPVLLGGALVEGSGDEGVAFVLDLSEQKRAERALRRSEALLAESQHLSQVGSFSWHVKTDEVKWSEQLYRIYEFEVGVPVTLEVIRTRVHPEDLSLLETNQTRRPGTNRRQPLRMAVPFADARPLDQVPCMQLLMRYGTRTVNWSTSRRFRMSRHAGCRKTHSTRRERSSHMWPGSRASEC